MSEKVMNEIQAEFDMFMHMIKHHADAQPVNPKMPNLNAQMAALTGATFIVEFADLNSLDIKRQQSEFDPKPKYEDLQKNIGNAMKAKNPNVSAVRAQNRFACDIVIPWNTMRAKYKKRYPRLRLPDKQEAPNKVQKFCQSTPNVTKQLRNALGDAMID